MQNNKNQDTPALTGYLQVLTVIASFIAPCIAFLSGIDTSSSVIAGFVFLFLLGTILFFRLWRKAQDAYIQNKPLPPPPIFWRILFNKLSPVRGKSTTKLVVTVLVIYDSSTIKQYEELCINFNSTLGDDNDLQIVPYNYSQKPQKKSLPSLLQDSQALYLFWTKEINDDADFRTILDSWSEKETQKPVLAVNMTDEPYTLPFDRVPLKEASTGLWRLLSKSIERTSLWHQQAGAYRNVWLFTSLVALVFLATSGFFYYQSFNLSNTLNKRDQSIVNHNQVISRKSQKLREKIASLYKTQNDNTNTVSIGNFNANENLNPTSDIEKINASLKNEIQTALNDYADYSYEELMNRMSNSPGEGIGHISFWRLAPNGGYYQQIARSKSNNESYRTFNINEATIIKCAIENNAFVLWRNNFANGDSAGWDIDGKLIGKWENGYVKFEPSSYTNPICQRTTIPDDGLTSGLLCLGIVSTSSEKNIKSGVCVDIPHKDKDFLQEAGTRNYLLQTTSILHLLPNELLKFTEDYEKKKE